MGKHPSKQPFRPSSPPGDESAAAPAQQPAAPGDAVKPRHSASDAFEQNPLSNVSERLSIKATEGLDDAGRVREALRIVIAEGVPLAEAARQCHVAPSFLAHWREKYLALLAEETSIAQQPLMEKGAVLKDADLVRIPQAAREHFAENWSRLVEITRATPSTFRQPPLRLFLENSWLTSWLFNEGELDRGAAIGTAVALSITVLAGTFIAAGHFYRQDAPPPVKVENIEEGIQRAATAAIAFFKAETAEAKMQLARPGEPVRRLMEDYFKKHGVSVINDAALTKAMPGEGMYALEFEVPSLNRKHLCVVVERDGRMLVDWETSSFFQEAHLEEIRKAKPRTPVRVAARVTEDNYYNYGFTDSGFTCYRLSYPGLELDLFAYAVKDSLEDQTLRALLQPVTASERNITAVMEVKYPAGDDIPANQVEIVRILQEDWVAP